MWKWVRISKSAALLAFILPWLTVSCSGQEISSPSGLGLLTGRFSVTNPMTGASEQVSGSPSLLILAAAIAIAVGLVFAFRSDNGSENSARIVFGTSIGALALTLFGTAGINGESIARAAAGAEAARGRQFGGQMVNSIIDVDYAFGFWVAVLALAAAAGIAWHIWQVQSGAPGSGPLAERIGALAGTLGSVGDTAHWDKIADKNDPDSLQEYLIRYPQGRFAGLARQKLERMDITPLAPNADKATPLPTGSRPEPEIMSRTCPLCGKRYAGEVSFCTADGTALS